MLADIEIGTTRAQLAPPLKWVGGKRWLATQLATEIEAAKPLYYVEPFLGGGAVMLALSSTITKIVADSNAALVNLWQVLKTSPTELIAETVALAKRFPNTALGYAQARDALNEALLDRRSTVAQAALVLHISARCFNGLWRENSSCLFNTPWNKEPKARSLALADALRYANALRQTTVVVSDFRATFASAMRTWVTAPRSRIAVYADSPYDGTFDGYTSGKFDETDQRDLAAWLKYLVGRGVRVWASNADTPLIREIYAWAKVDVLEERHIVGSTGARRGKRACLMIRG